MTLALAPTGSSLGDYEQIAAHNATVTARHTRLWTVDATLRDTLGHFDDTITAPMAAVAMLRAGTGLTETFVIERGTAFYDVVSTIAKKAADELPGGVAGNDDAVTVAEDLARRVGVPVNVVLAAAGISRSTYYSWKKPAAPRPRVASQGRLWALAQTVEDLEELLGGSPRGWLLADPTRLELLSNGNFDELLRTAEPSPAPRTTGAPAYAGAYGIGGDRTDPETTEVAVPRLRKVSSAQPARRSRRPR